MNRWLELWNSVKRYQTADGEVLAELSLSNGLWIAYGPRHDYVQIGAGGNVRALKSCVELALAGAHERDSPPRSFQHTTAR
jgi:hypothetical protein